MESAWLSFAIVALSQLMLFVGYVCYTKRFSDVITILRRGILTGIVVGLLSNLLLGKLLGFWSYTLGFGPLSLIMAAVFIYGLFACNVLLLQNVGFRHFFIWIMTTMVVYESTNYLFQVWTYELPFSTSGLLLFLIIGYLGTAIFMAVVWHKILMFVFTSSIPY